MMDAVYLIPTRWCNLNCDHCDIKRNGIRENFDKFYSAFEKLDCNNCILFGGEPLTLRNGEIKKLLSSGKVSSISTNLTLLRPYVHELLIKNKISVSTSWNPYRFSDGRSFMRWYSNVCLLLENKIDVTILVTLTNDLIESKDGNSKFMHILKLFSDLSTYKDFGNHLKGIRFEPYVQSDSELIEKMDDLMVSVYKADFKFFNILADDYKNGNLHRCDGIYTLNPDGNLIHSCPHDIRDNLLEECLSCKYSKVCKPCKKQKVCTFFKKLYEVVNNGN